jgi:hypothetical protein
MKHMSLHRIITISIVATHILMYCSLISCSSEMQSTSHSILNQKKKVDAREAGVWTGRAISPCSQIFGARPL